jgi:DNA-binding response OmpR family regulator
MGKILCVTDNSLFFASLCSLLVSERYDCFGATSALHAESRFIADRPDLVILDGEFAEPKNRALATTMKQLRNVKVLILTTDRDLQKPDCVDRLLIKSSEPATLLSAISELLR